MCARVTRVKRPSKVTLLAGPEELGEGEVLEHARDAVVVGNAERLVFLVAVAEGGVDDDAPVRDDVERRDVLRHLHGVLEGNEDGEEDVHIGGLGADAGHRGERLEHLVGVREVVLAAVDVVVAEFAGGAHEVEHVGEPLHHIAVAAVLEES